MVSLIFNSHFNSCAVYEIQLQYQFHLWTSWVNNRCGKLEDFLWCISDLVIIEPYPLNDVQNSIINTTKNTFIFSFYEANWELNPQAISVFLDSLWYWYIKSYLKFDPIMLLSLKPNLSFPRFKTNKQIQKPILHLVSKWNIITPFNQKLWLSGSNRNAR